MYSNNNKEYAEKIQYYCKLATDLPVDVLSRLRVYSYWVQSYKYTPDSSGIPYYSQDENECMRNRRKAFTIALKSYNLVKDLELPKEEQKIKHNNEIERREKIIYENYLIGMKNSLFNHVIELYSIKPYKSDEFYSILLESLEDRNLATELLKQLEKKYRNKKNNIS